MRQTAAKISRAFPTIAPFDECEEDVKTHEEATTCYPCGKPFVEGDKNLKKGLRTWATSRMVG